DNIHTSKFSSTISALAGDDAVILPAGAGNGNYFIDGGSGIDTLVVSQASSTFSIVRYGSDFLLQSKDGSQGVSLLRSIEDIQFSDQSVVLDNTVHLTAPATIQQDHLAIMRTELALDQATTIANAINAGTQTETQYVNDLLSQVVNTTIPAVAVEASMYGVTGTSAEITNLTANFLPAQVANAISYGLNSQVYACEVVGLAFAFGNETGSTAFSDNFGPSNSSMPNTAAGDAAFATAACNTIFGAASTANLANVMKTF